MACQDYGCIYADVWTIGRVSDGGVWNKCTLVKELEKNELSIPASSCLPLGVNCVPYVFVGVDALALTSHLMKALPTIWSSR